MAELLQGIYLRRTLAVWVMWFCCFYCNFGMVIWLPSLYTSIYKLPLAVALKYGLITQAVGLLANIAAALLADRLGRRLMFTGAFTWSAICLLALWLMGKTSAQTLLIMTSLAFLGVSAIAISLWLYTPEIYPTRMRALGCGIGTAWYRIAVIIAPMMLGLIISKFALQYGFLMYGAVALLGAIVTGLFGTETKGRVLEEVSP